MKLKENLAYNLNRLIIGTIILLILFSVYFLNLDFLLYSFVVIIIFYEFYKSVIKDRLIISSLFILFIFESLLSYFLIDNFIFFANVLIILIIYNTCFLVISGNIGRVIISLDNFSVTGNFFVRYFFR